MPGPYFAEQGLLLVKSEVTYGTDPTPAPATDALFVSNLRISPDPKFLQREGLHSSLSMPADVAAGTLVNVSFDFEIKGANGTAADTPARYAPVLKAFEFGEDINAGTDVTYEFVDTGFASCTIYAYMGGATLHKVSGVFGRRLTIRETAREYGKFSAEMSGLYTAPTDAAIAAGAVFDTSQPVKLESVALLLDAYSPIISNLEINLDTGLSLREDLNSPESIIGFIPGRRNVTGRMVIETVTEATYAFWSKFKAGTTIAITGNVIGTVAKNKVAITAPAAQIANLTYGAKDRLLTYEATVNFRATTDSAADELKIVTS